MNKAEEEEFRAYAAARMDRWRSTAFLLCRDWHLADDLVSITVGKIFRHWRQLSQADNPDAYAQRILTRTWLDEQRRPWHRRERSRDTLPETTVTEADRVLDREGLDRLLTSLGPRQRAVVVLRYYLDYSIEETAEILGVTEGTVKSQSARGLVILRSNAAKAGA
ncbi:RNA polymerase sigma-70 factor (sigma-E family) [Allocatelliglobosispora scoriae]|uniref:RNA polymerase sigma-70 factor (Sigma-E family) n=1 Tax=Allocatelliglobosispora scoriae TaxID=643052 RepID=A0A841BM97_9ACTN|nr:SigE family RNA polymerase sigma factor [Allocatelliglobosispora scoriae]MBB5867882.1 RNA polymerase sigma-70 factor (sigma-E family) [Allocatelliglobosispora scoriae]